MVSARRIADDLWIVDTLHQGEPGVIAVYLLSGTAGLGLVDVGPAATVGQVTSGIESAGFQVGDLRHLVLTHVHLDHAGAVGALAEMAPGARIYVHPLGAPHLVDPTKLVASAQRIYGAEMNRLWGVMKSVPETRIQMVRDGDRLRVGNHLLRALYTPGHAVHHVAYYHAAEHGLFAGDVAGVALEGIPFVRPPTPPPDLNLEDWSESLERLRELNLERIYLPHFGPVTRVTEHLSQLESRLYEWGDLVLNGMRNGRDTNGLVAALVDATEPELRRLTQGRDDEAVRRYELATNYRMTVEGYERYYRKRHPEWLAAK